MSEPLRVPMPERPSFIGNDDIAAHITRTPKYARRFSMDVAEDALAQMGQNCIPVIAEDLAKHIVHRHADLIESTVNTCLCDKEGRERVQRIIDTEVRRAVRRQAEKMVSLMDVVRAERFLAENEEDSE